MREKRERRDAERAEAQRDLEQEEENLGRELEAKTARERRRWERTYGGGESTVSGSGDGISEKKMRNSHAESSNHQSEVEVIEMSDISDEHHKLDPLMACNAGKEGNVTVRVAEDEMPGPSSTGDGSLDDEKMRHLSSVNATEKLRASQQLYSEPPEVVPLPFKVPAGAEGDAASERSSIATFADDADEVKAIEQRRPSLAKRLSQGSVTLLRSLSQRSRRNSNDLSPKHGESSEGLVNSPSNLKEDNESIAATMDRASLDETERQSFDSDQMVKPTEITAQLSSDHPEQDSHLTTTPSISQGNSLKEPDTRRISAHTASSDVQADTDHVAAAADGASNPVEQSNQDDGEQPADSEAPKSVLSSLSKRSLTKDRLPQSLSKVALSYRTNEWAKHLSHADTPEPDALNIIQPSRSTRIIKENPAPVKVEELQQYAEQGVPVSISKRSESRTSQTSSAQPPPAQSRTRAPPPPINPNIQPAQLDGTQTQSPIGISPTGPPQKRQSWSSLTSKRVSGGFDSIPEKVTTPIRPDSRIADNSMPIAQLPVRSASASRIGTQSPGPTPGVISHASPQSLLGQRDLELRKRSTNNLLASIPEPDTVSSRAASDAGSMHNYPMYAAAMNADLDNMPLSQRKSFIRQGSRASLAQGNQSMPVSIVPAASSLAKFDSHQPQRVSTLPTAAIRESQLAQFRQSVASDLRSGTQVFGLSGRETPLTSTKSVPVVDREAEIQRNIDMQRNAILNQKDAEAQRREMQRQQKEWQDRAFDEQMRNGNFLEAHREMLRRMQNGAKEN